MLVARTGDGDLAAAGEIGFSPTVLFLSPRDGQVKRQVALSLNGNFNATDVLATRAGVVAVGGYQDRDRPRDRDLQEDVLIFKVH
jgi:hypothetical protein